MVLVPESDPRANITHHTFNDVLPLLMGKYLGPGLLGLGVTAMIAGFMSGMAGNVSAFATVWTYDVYRPLLSQNASDHHYLNMGRWCSIIGVLLSIGTAYFALLLLEHSRLSPGADLLLHRAAVRRRDYGHAVEAVRRRPAGSGASSSASCFAIGMWLFVHTFPDGHRPVPQVALAEDAVVKLQEVAVKGEKTKTGKRPPICGKS